jgi:hypothetical protein
VEGLRRPLDLQGRMRWWAESTGEGLVPAAGEMGSGRRTGLSVDELISSGEKLRGRFRKITRANSFSGRREYAKLTDRF